MIYKWIYKWIKKAGSHWDSADWIVIDWSFYHLFSTFCCKHLKSHNKLVIYLEHVLNY